MAGIGRRVFLSSDPPAESQPEQALQAGRRTTPLPDQGIEQLGLDTAGPVSIGQVLRDCQSRGDGGQDLCRAEPGSPGPVCPSLPPGDGEPGSRTGQSLQGEPLPRARHPGEEADQHSQPSQPGHTGRAQSVQLSPWRRVLGGRRLGAAPRRREKQQSGSQQRDQWSMRRQQRREAEHRQLPACRDKQQDAQHANRQRGPVRLAWFPGLGAGAVVRRDGCASPFMPRGGKRFGHREGSCRRRELVGQHLGGQPAQHPVQQQHEAA